MPLLHDGRVSLTHLVLKSGHACNQLRAFRKRCATAKPCRVRCVTKAASAMYRQPLLSDRPRHATSRARARRAVFNT